MTEMVWRRELILILSLTEPTMDRTSMWTVLIKMMIINIWMRKPQPTGRLKLTLFHFCQLGQPCVADAYAENLDGNINIYKFIFST